MISCLSSIILFGWTGCRLETVVAPRRATVVCCFRMAPVGVVALVIALLCLTGEVWLPRGAFAGGNFVDHSGDVPSTALVHSLLQTHASPTESLNS